MSFPGVATHFGGPEGRRDPEVRGGHARRGDGGRGRLRSYRTRRLDFLRAGVEPALAPAGWFWQQPVQQDRQNKARDSQHEKWGAPAGCCPELGRYDEPEARAEQFPRKHHAVDAGSFLGREEVPGQRGHYGP